MADETQTEMKDGGEAEKQTESKTKSETTAEPKADAKPAEPEWLASVTDEKVKKWGARYSSPADLAVEAYKLRQKVSNAIIPPGKDAKPEEIQEFRKKWGVPLNPEGYNFEMPSGQEPNDNDKAFQRTIADVFHKVGINQSQASELTRVWNSFTAEIQRQTTENDEAQMRATEVRQKKRWGGDYDRNLAASKAFLDEFASGTELDKSLFTNLVVRVGKKDMVLANVPIVQELLAFAGNRLMEAKAHAPMDQEYAQSASKRITELTRLMNTDEKKYRSDAVQKELRELHEQMAKERKRRAA